MQLLSGGPVIIYFIQDSTCSNKDMGKAFLACQDAKLKPRIISEEEINDVPHGTNVVFVLEEFRGKTFKDLSSSDSLVVGPRCLHYCIKNEVPIPSNESPVFTMALKGVIATASKLPKNRKEEVASTIGFMGGSYTDQLTAAVTHLISDDGRSPKCEKAIEHKIPIMKSEWVNAVWEASKNNDISGFDAEFMKYKLPPFKGMHISCSNLNQAKKKEIQAAVESNGGVYMTALEQNKTTALIIREADGKKFQAAQLWGIPCLVPEWIFDSAEKGMALPSKNYLINPRPKCSTPTNDLPSFMSNDVSCIPFGNESNNTVDETNSTATSINSFRCQPTKTVVKPPPMKPHIHEYKKFIEEINLSDAGSGGIFLDGCKVFLSGFNSQEMDKMKKLINRSGATLFPEISDRLSHVIMGEFLPEHVKEIEKLSHKPQVVSVEWILASIRLKTAAPAEPYLCFKTSVTKNGPVPPASPLSHKGLSLLKSNSNSESPKSAAACETPPTSRKLFVKAPVMKRTIQDDHVPLINKESDAPSLPAVQTNPPDALAQPIPVEVAEPPAPSAAAPEPQHDNTDLSCNGSSIDISPFFKGLVFLVIGFDDPTTIIESIFAVSGKVESSHFQGVADYAVIPLNGVSTQSTATEVVTPLWVEDCYEQNQVIPIEYYHQPVPHKPEITPLKGCVVCVSGYVGKERTFIFHLAEALGALVQDSFSRKDHPAKKIYKSTHLVCKAPTGSKYNAAVKWGVPVVSEKWLLACVSCGTLAPIELHQFGEKGEVPITPVNPSIQRVKSVTLDASNAIVDITPSRACEAPARVNETTQKDIESASKLKDSFAKPCSPAVEPGRTAMTSRADASGRRSSVASPAAERAECNDVTIPSEGADEGFKGRITPRNSFHNNTTVDCFNTPANVKRMSSISSAGKSPFHIDTPTSPYGRVFMDEGVNPSPDTRKKWKRFIDNMPDLYEGSPEVQEFRKRRPSTPLNVIMKQVWVKFGGAEIDGIDPQTGDLVPNGPFGEWAHENTSLCSNDVSQPKANDDNSRENPVMNPELISKELSHLKSRLNSVLTPSQQRVADNDLGTPEASTSVDPEKACHARAGNWITPKGIEKQTAQTEMQWDFGKPTISVSRQNQNIAKKLRLSHGDDDSNIREQVTKLFDNDSKETPKEEKKIFVLSQMSASSRDTFEGIIKSLGGEVSNSNILEPRTTHLVVEKILRSEKLLCAVASGKWVLHSSYLTQCYQSRMFLPEEDYEWGNERSQSRLPSIEPGTTEWNFAQAVHKWRVRKTDMGQPDAFRHFKAVILTSENKLAQYMRLLQAGNATILPKERILEATHVFWDEGKVSLPVDRAILKSKKIPLLKPVYLGDYLAKSPPPSVEEYCVR